MSHVTKILLTIILYRNSAAIDREIGANQRGFRKGKGTREGIFNLEVVQFVNGDKYIWQWHIDANTYPNNARVATFLFSIGE